MEQKFKKPEEEDNFDAGFKIPDTKSALAGLSNALYNEHRQIEEEEEKQGTDKAKKRQKPKGGTICVCGHPSCRIGGFVEKQGE